MDSLRESARVTPRRPRFIPSTSYILISNLHLSLPVRPSRKRNTYPLMRMIFVYLKHFQIIVFAIATIRYFVTLFVNRRVCCLTLLSRRVRTRKNICSCFISYVFMRRTVKGKTNSGTLLITSFLRLY